MKVLDVTRENLEDLLAYDDLFLDYFNAFLSLPVFPQALVYNRLTGGFEELETSSNSAVSSSLLGVTCKSQHYGPNNIEREKMLEWAKEERLPIFLRTQLFRELKLCKLLLRPLVDRNSGSRGSSRQIRGYSRQSESYVSSFSNSADNSADDVLDDDEGWPELRYSALYKYCRPGSRALSVPIKISYQGEEDNENVSDITSTSSFSITKSAGLTLMRHTSTGHHQHALPPVMQTIESASRSKSSAAVANNNNTAKRATRISSRVEIFNPEDTYGRGAQSSRVGKHTQPSSTEEAFIRGSRVLSAPVNYEYYLKRPFNNCDFETLFGEVEPEPIGKSYVTFEDEDVDDEQTEMDVRNLEGQLKITIQQLKEHVLGTYAGVEGFREFLENTSGLHLLNFWLDCEYYKDLMEDENDVDCVEQRNRLFRDIQDKYKFNLSQDAKEQISKSASNMGLSHTIFLRTQYDILRRLRVYWVPRYLIHFQRTKHFTSNTPNRRQLLWAMKKATPSNPVPFFPSISLVQSTPMRPEDILKSHNIATWDSIDKSSTSKKMTSTRQSLTTPHSMVASVYAFSRHRSSKERFLLALSTDRLSGGPFEKYLANQTDKNLLSNLLFWQDVTEYGATEDKSADRLLRLQHAWAIFNKYLSHDSPYNIDLSNKHRDELHEKLLNARDFVDASVYDVAKYKAVQKLETNWIRYLKEDLKAFLDCRVRPEGGSPPSTAEAIEIIVTDTDVVIKRPRPWVRRYPGSSNSERARRLNRALSLAEDIDEERMARNKLLRKERRKEMERERKKAVRAAYRRQRESKFGPSVNKETKPVSQADADGVDGIHVDAEEIVKDLPTFVEMHSNKQVMAMFRKHLQEDENKEMIYLQSLHNDLTAHFDLENKQKKDAHAGVIYKTYLDQQNSKKFVMMSDSIMEKLEEERDRPKSATMKEMKKYVLSKIEECFKEFLLYQSDEFGVSPNDLSTMSQAEIAMRMGSDNYGSWSKKKGKGKSSGRAQPSKEDKHEFLQSLGESAAGHLTVPMLYFYKYLVKHGQEDGMPLIDKDLFFYIEVQKFKAFNHAFSNEEILRAKVQSMVDCFLESVTAPALQIDIPADCHSRTLKASHRYLQGKEMVTSIFDDAQFAVFKELMPYWAGFRKSYAIPADKHIPETKYQKMVRRRREAIENYQTPEMNFNLPSIPEGAMPVYTISLSDGARFKGVDLSDDSSVCTPAVEHRPSRLMAGSVDNLRKSHKSVLSSHASSRASAVR